MRTLRFLVNGQRLSRDPACDFSGLVSGTKNYFRAEFVFSPDWAGMKKAARFTSASGEEYEGLVNDGCTVPETVLRDEVYTVTVYGLEGDTQITTNSVKLLQRRGSTWQKP